MTPRHGSGQAAVPGAGQVERLAFNAGSARREVTSPYAVPADVAATAAQASATAAASDAQAPEPRDMAFTWTLIFTFILFFRPQDVFGPLGHLHLAEVSAITALVALFTGRLRRGQSLTRMTPEFIGILVFAAVILLTAPFSIWLGGALGMFTDQFVKVMLVYLLAVNVLNSPKRIERLTWVLVLVVGYIAFRAVFDYARGVNVIAHGTRVRGSVGGLLENPNDMALHMVVFFPFALFMALRPESTIKRLIAAGAGLAMIGAIVASGSRGGFLGFAVMIVVVAIYAARQRPALVFAGVLAFMCALPIVPDQYWRRISSITDDSKDDYESAQARRELFAEAYQAFLDNPITGVGAGQFKDYDPGHRQQAWHETHNIWLQVASETGIFGFAAFTYLVFLAFSSVAQTRRLLARARAAASAARRRRSARKALAAPVISEYDGVLLDAHSAAMVAALIGFFVCSFFASVAYNWTFYYLLALAAAPRDVLRAKLPLGSRRAAAESSTALNPAPLGLGARGAGA